MSCLACSEARVESLRANILELVTIARPQVQGAHGGAHGVYGFRRLDDGTRRPARGQIRILDVMQSCA